MKQAVLAALLLQVLQSALVAAVPVTPATPEVTATAQGEARTAFSTAKALKHTTLPADTVAVGPRLWAVTVDARKPFATETKDTYATVSPAIVSKWKLAPIDLTTIADPTLRSALTEASKSGMPVLAGAIMTRGNDILPALLLSQLKPGDFPLSVRTPTESELEYYYSLIPYDLTDPILVVEGRGHAFICDFEDGKLFYVEML